MRAAAEGPEWPGSEAAFEPAPAAFGARGGKSFATQRSPCGDGVRR